MFEHLSKQKNQKNMIKADVDIQEIYVNMKSRTYGTSDQSISYESFAK